MIVNLKRFGFVFVATAVGLMVLTILVDLLFGFDIQNAGMSLIPMMIASMLEGQKYAQTSREPIDAPWKHAVMMAAIGTLLNILILAVMAAIFPDIRDLFANLFGIVSAVIVVVFVLFILVGRFFLTFGAKQIWKAQDRASQK